MVKVCTYYESAYTFIDKPQMLLLLQCLEEDTTMMPRRLAGLELNAFAVEA